MNPPRRGSRFGQLQHASIGRARPADEWAAGNVIPCTEALGGRPAELRSDLVVARDLHYAAVLQRYTDSRATSSQDRAVDWEGGSDTATVPTEHGIRRLYVLDQHRPTICQRHRRAGREAPDVVAHTRWRDVTLVCDGAANRLAVAGMVVGAEDAELGVAGGHAALELGEAALVHLAEGLDPVHGGVVARRAADASRERGEAAGGALLGSRCAAGGYSPDGWRTT